MKKLSAITLTVAVLMLGLVMFAGCSGNSDEPKRAVCFVVGNTANAEGLNLKSELVSGTTYDVIKNYGFIAAVNVDGNPEIAFMNDYNIADKYKSASEERLKADAEKKNYSTLLMIQDIIADDTEVDYLKSLTLAVEALASLDGYDTKEIIVLGTGLSTTGIMDFRNNLLSAEPETVVDQLDARKAIPDFSGMKVSWQHLGKVAYPQQSLSPSQLSRLEELYKCLITRGGGEFSSQEMPTNHSEKSGYPSVSLVELPSDSPIAFEMQNTMDFDKPVSLSEDQVTFVADKADYLQPDEATATISPIADYMLHKNTNITLLLVGCIAGDTNSDFGDALSQSRAEKVKSTLVGLGVPETRLIAKGMGCSDPWHVKGVGYEGKLASQNRKVVLLDTASDTAKQILS